MSLSIMEIFFANNCNKDHGTYVPDCRGCNYNERGVGCTSEENPMNKAIKEVGK